VEEQPPARGRGVDRLLQHDQADATGLQDAGEVDQVFEGAASTVELGDHELVAAAEVVQGLVELGAGGELAGGATVDEHTLAPGALERVELGVGMLVAGGHPRVADLGHAAERRTNGGQPCRWDVDCGHGLCDRARGR